MLKKRLIICFAVAVAVVSLPSIGKADNFENGAKRFIETLADDALKTLIYLR